MRILIAEDEHYSRKALRQLLTRFDPAFIIDEAEDGDEANALLELRRYDLMICDIRMPGMDGLMVSSRAIRANRADNVVLLTGYAEFHYAIEALHIGVRDYLLKPVDTTKLYEILDSIQGERPKKYQDETVDKLIRYLQDHYDEKLSISEVCRSELYLHPAYVSRHYKKVTGETIIATLQRIRMNRAFLLLTRTQSSVSKIGELCGYAETSTFIQAFRKTYGMTPLEFRANSHRAGHGID